MRAQTVVECDFDILKKNTFVRSLIRSKRKIWSDCVDRNDKVFTLLYKIVMHKKVSHPDEIQNIYITNIYLRTKVM